jgi:hypothetical protein
LVCILSEFVAGEHGMLDVSVMFYMGKNGGVWVQKTSHS